MADRDHKAYRYRSVDKMPMPTDAERKAIRRLFRGTASAEQQKMAAAYLITLSGMNDAPDPGWASGQAAFFNGMVTVGRLFTDIGQATLMAFASEDTEKQEESFPKDPS